MNRTDRLYAIVEALRRTGNRGRTCGWLADAFSVSTRTIKRDVATLVSAGVPVCDFDGRGGGYSLSSQATLPPLSFTDAEAVAVAIALKADLDMPFATDGRAALGKLLHAMTNEQRKKLRDVGHRIWMQSSTPAPARNSVTRVVEEAVRENTALTLEYADGNGHITRQRFVEPMACARTQGKWYLLAWCDERRRGRWFRMDRILHAIRTNRPNAPRDIVEVFGAPPSDAQPLSRLNDF